MNHQIRFKEALQSGNRLYRWQKYLVAPFKPRLFYIRNSNNLQAALQSVNPDSPLAMAITWRPNYSCKVQRPEGQKQFHTAVLQLADMRNIWLIHLTYMKTLYPVLRDILENPAIVKVGFGIQRITQRLGNEFSVSVPNCVDLGLMANALDHYTWNSPHAGSASAPPSLLSRASFQGAHPTIEYGTRIPEKFRPNSGPYLYHDTPLNTPNTPGTGKTYVRGKPRPISGPTPPGGPPPPRVTGYVYRAQVSGSAIPQLPTIPLIGDHSSLQVRNTEEGPTIAGMGVPTIDDVGISINEMASKYIARTMEEKRTVTRSDWQQVLDDEHMKYAANEVHVNLALYLHLLDTFALRAREDWLLGPRSTASPRSPQSLLPDGLYPLPSSRPSTPGGSSPSLAPHMAHGRSVLETTPQEVAQLRRLAEAPRGASTHDVFGEDSKAHLQQMKEGEKRMSKLRSTGALFAGEMRRAATAMSKKDAELTSLPDPSPSPPSPAEKAAANEKMKAQISSEVEMRLVAKEARWAKRRKQDMEAVVQKLSRNEDWPETRALGRAVVHKPIESGATKADDSASPASPACPALISKDELRQEVRLRSLRAALNSPSRAHGLFAFDSILEEGSPKIQWRG